MANIKIFDGEVPFPVRERVLNACAESNFVLGWSDRPPIDGEKSTACTHSSWSLEQAERTGILDCLSPCTERTDWFVSRGLETTVVNLVRSNDVHYIHSHPGKQVALYYAQLDWQDGWYGETMFYKENLNEVAFCSTYTPGRIVLFDGNIPHAIRPQSVKAPKYRITVTFIFNYVEQVSEA